MVQDPKTSDWAMGLHLTQLIGYAIPIPFAGVLTPLILWQVMRRQYPGLDPHGKNAINWIISSAIYSILLLVSVVGILLLPFLWGCSIVFPVIAAFKARNGEVWSYPLTINFVGDRAERSLRRAALGLLSFGILPLVGVVGSSYWVNQQGQWLSGLSETQGTVIDVKEKLDSEGDAVYKPVIQYQDSTGESYTMSPWVWSNSSSYRRGGTAPILYAPEKPNTALIDNWFEKWGLSVGVLVVFAVLLFFALVPSIIAFLLSFWM